MTVRNFIERRPATGFRRSFQADDVQLAKACRELAAQIDSTGANLGESLEAFIGRMRALWRQDQTLDQASKRDVRAMARHVFSREAGTSLSKESGLINALLVRIRSEWSPQATRNLASAFFHSFLDDRNSLLAISETLSETPQNRRAPALELWLQEGFVDTGQGAQRLATKLLTTRDVGVREALERLYFVGGLESCEFVARAYEICCAYVRAHGRDEPNLFLQLLDWSRAADSQDGGKIELVFPGHAGPLADALLLPWCDAIPSNSAMQARIRSFLVAALGDPRFARSSAQWNRVDPEAAMVLRQWLTQASVEQFFDIVTETMSDYDERRMWRYRRKFWTAYLPHITDAWVVFGARGAELARDKARYTDDAGFEKFGSFNKDRPVHNTHAVLVIRLGDLMIAEWSHNGKCRMWRKSDPRAPAPYQTRYRVSDLRDGWWEASHTGNETYGWQSKFASQIRTETGIAMNRSDYRVDL